MLENLLYEQLFFERLPLYLHVDNHRYVAQFKRFLGVLTESRTIESFHCTTFLAFGSVAILGQILV